MRRTTVTSCANLNKQTGQNNLDAKTGPISDRCSGFLSVWQPHYIGARDRAVRRGKDFCHRLDESP